jgi:peptidoglycan/LPS O-acetylase OafA/YrhL
MNQFFLNYFILGFLGTYFCWSLSYYISKKDILKFEYLGNISLEIYLWHTTIIGMLGIILLFIGITNFWSLIVIIFFATIVINLIIAKLLQKMPRISYLLYGRKVTK